MATLVSPGVDVTVVDESAYASPGAGTIPLIIVATAQDKTDPTGTETDGIAKYTKAANANLVVPVTSQRELTQFFGDPTFDTGVQGSETSEYGLLAAYSYLGQGSQAYIVRADVDLDELSATDSAPTGPANGNQVWIDTDGSSYGVHQWVASSSAWVLQNVTVEVALDASAGEVADPKTYVPSTGAQPVGSYLVAILNDGPTSPTGAVVGYFYSDGSAWQSVDQANVANLPGSTVSYAPHFSSPAAPVDGDIWVKTTQPGNGLNLVVYQSNSQGVFTLLNVDGVDDDANAQTITAISQANPAVVTVGSTANMEDGDVVFITGVVGMTEVNDRYFTVNVESGTTISLVGEDSTGHTAYTSGGSATYFIPQDGTSLDTVALVDNEIVVEVTAANGGFEVKRIEDNLPEAIDDVIYAQDAEPTGTPVVGTYWFDSTQTDLDILIHTGTAWSRVADADITYATVEPLTPADNDIWVETDGTEGEYPKVYRYDSGANAWLLYDNTDQTTERGVLFDDFTVTSRDTLASGDVTGADLLDSAPDFQLYPTDMLAVNMAVSSNTVRVWNEGMPVNDGAATVDGWVNGVLNNANGSGAFGRLAQRRLIATQMQAAVAGNEDLRDPNRNFTLLCAPNFPELTDELVTLNSDRGETGFIIIDTPMRLTPTEAVNWIEGVGATENGEEGLVTKNTYSAVYYPPARSTTPDGETVTVPASHITLYTYAYNDNIAYPWFAPAGLTRGVVQNGSAVGYITSEEEFKAVSLSQGQRDSLYLVNCNPIAQFPLEGVVVFGQKTLHPFSSALDRVNVARLVAYLRERFDEIARPLLFEQNDRITRQRAVQLFESFLSDLLTKRALTDFAVVCDESNNTPIRIDRNELYIDVAIAPTKAVEFIYIPIRIVNTGAL